MKERIFAEYALLLLFLFAIAYLSGFSEYVGILSGTLLLDPLLQFCGAIYLVLYAAFVVVVPILFVASLLGEMLSLLKKKDRDRRLE